MSGAELITLRLDVLGKGWSPIPVTSPDFVHEKCKSPGKAPFFKDWQKLTRDTITPEVVRSWQRIKMHGNTGLLCGDLLALDLDIYEPGLAKQVEALATAMLPTTPMVRIGQSPKSLRCYRNDEPRQKCETPELFLPDGSKNQIEAMGLGQQIVGFGVHPDTGQPYRWLTGDPTGTAFDTLPIVTKAELEAFLQTAEAVIRAAGGRTKKEIEPEATAKPPAQHAPEAKANTATGNAKVKGESFFKQVNRAALGDLAAWVKRLFPKAEKQQTGAWRVSSADLGRDYEEDLSIHPAGVQDFGPREGKTPCDLVMHFGGAPDVVAAAMTLCEWMGRDPASLGWTPRVKLAPSSAVGRDGRPVIRIVPGELHTATTAGETAIMEAGKPIYQRGDTLVRPIVRDVAASKGRTTKAAGLGEQTPFAMLDLLSEVAEWQRYDGRAKDWLRINPPKDVGHILLTRQGRWKFPPIAGVVTSPTLKPDGSILAAPGYDPVTRLFHVVDETLKLHPELHRPTRQLAERSLEFLNKLLPEFPFVIVKGADGKEKHVAKAVALSAIITPVVRGALSVAPLHAFRATTPGSGKSYLADVASTVSTGRPCPVISAAPDEAETEKRIAGLLLAGYPVVSIDNVNGELGGDLLCQAIERPLIRLRRLGGSDITEIENRASMFATGNQMRVRGDMVRRTLVSDLDANMERPELKKFEADPVAMVLANRGHYVSACLMIVRAYIAAGKPGRLAPVASFGDWSDLVRSALVWLGCDDPALSMEAARADDPELTELREMLAIWAEALGFDGVTVAEVAKQASLRTFNKEDEPTGFENPELHDVMLRLFGEHGNVNTRRVAKWLASREGRIVDGYKFVRSGKAEGGVIRWAVNAVIQP